MTTPHLQEELSAYLAGELAGRDLERAEAHLSDCAECRGLLERLKQVDAALNEDPHLEPSTGFASQVLQRVDRGQKVVAFRARKAVAWVALAAAIVFVLLLLRVQREVQPPAEMTQKPPAERILPPPQPQVAEQSPPVEMAQVETPPVQAPQLSPEDAELIAYLQELEDMELIADYESLKELNTAVFAVQMEQMQ